MPEYSPNKSSENAQRSLTWSSMLAKWTEFAKASTALPEDGDGPHWRACVVPIVNMQAMIAALGELDQLPRAQRPVAIDASETLLREQVAMIHEAWAGEVIPDALRELMEESRQTLFNARHTGLEWRIAAERCTAPDLQPMAERIVAAGFTGDLHAARPGATLFRGAPLAFFSPPMDLDPPAECESVEVVGPRQCYRQMGKVSGAPYQDLIAGPGDPLLPGLPLIAPLVRRGEFIASVSPSPGLPEGLLLPVVEYDAG